MAPKMKCRFWFIFLKCCEAKYESLFHKCTSFLNLKRYFSIKKLHKIIFHKDTHANYIIRKRERGSEGRKGARGDTGEKKVIMEYTWLQTTDQDESKDSNNVQKTLRIESGINDLYFKLTRSKGHKL